jgi:WD40 repeat protein
VSLTALSVAVALPGGRAAAVPPALLETTAAAAARLSTAQGLAGVVSANVAALLKQGNLTMALTGLKAALLALVGTALLAGGTALVYGFGQPAGAGTGADHDRQAGEAHSGSESPPAKGRTDWYGDPLPAEALARLGTVRFRPGEHVWSLRFARDGKRLVTQSDSGPRVWDAGTGRELRRIGPAAKSVGAGDVSADGTVAVTGDQNRLGSLRTWDVKTGRQLREFGKDGPYPRVRMSPDGKTVAARGIDGRLDLWDVATGTRRHSLREDVGPHSVTSTLSFSADGKRLACAADRTVRCWDVATGREVRLITCPEPVGLVALSPDGKRLASVGLIQKAAGQGVIHLTPDRRVRLWELATGKPAGQLKAREKPGASAGITAVAFTPDGKSLVTAGIDYVLRTWDAATQKELRAFPGCSTNMGALALSPNGKSAAIVNGGTALRIIDLATGKDAVPLAGHDGGVYATALAPDGRTVYTAGGDGDVRAWSAATGKLVRRLPGTDRWVAGLALSPDGRRLYALASDTGLQTWDTATGKPLRPAAGGYDASAIGLMALSADGKLLAVAPVKSGLHLIDAGTGKHLRSFAGLDGRHCTGAGFAPDGRTLVAWTTDQEVHVLDTATGRTRKRFSFAGDGNRRLSYAAALSPHGRLVAFGSQSRFLAVMDVATGKEVRRFDRLPDGVSSVAFAPDGRSLAWGGWTDPTIHLLELSTREERHQFKGHEGRILTLRFSADGRALLSGGNDATALVWDLAGRLEPKADDGKDLSAEEAASLWKDLGTASASRAHGSMRRLARSPAAMRFLATNLRAVAAPAADRVAKLLADLDNDDFQVRQRATKELERLGDGVTGACRKALAEKPSAEMRRRLEKLLDRQAALVKQPSAERVRLMRSLEVLELAGTEGARKLLARLAKGAPGAWLTEEAEAGRARLDRRGGTR